MPPFLETALKCRMNSTFINKEFEVATVVTDNIDAFCGAFKDNTENLEYYCEDPEAIDTRWIECLRKETRALERWQMQQTLATSFRYIQGDAFIQCPLPHPHDDLPSTDPNRNDDFGTANLLTLERTLSGISKANRCKEYLRNSAEHIFHSDVKNESSFPHISADAALEKYCQEHAYSRARLLRTDRRSLANELLEQMTININKTEKLSHSRNSEPALQDSQFFPQHLNVKNTSSTKPLNGDASSSRLSTSSCETDSERKVYKHTNNSASFSDRTANAESHINSKAFKGKETVNKEALTTTVRKTSSAVEVHKPLTVTPCVFFSSKVPCESRNRIIHRHKPKFIN